MNEFVSTRPVDKLTVVVSTVVDRVITIDQFSPEWSWLQDHPRDQWQRLLEDSANTTDGQVEIALEDGELDAAYRDVRIIGPHTMLPKSDITDPWGL